MLAVYPRQTVLIVSVDDRYLATLLISKTDPLIYSYTHSVERTEVREFFVIKEQRLVLTHTEMQSFGAGLPTEQGEGLTFRDGWFVLELHRDIPRLSLRVDPSLNQRLISAGITIDLSSFDTGKPIDIRVARRPLIWLRLKEVLS